MLVGTNYIFIPLDIFREMLHNKGITNELEAWLAFLCEDDPDVILQLIESRPAFKPMYIELYHMCQNVQGVMDMFSKKLLELDRNTVQYMIDEMQETIEKQKKELEEIVQQKQQAVQEKQKADLEMQKARQRIAELESLLQTRHFTDSVNM